MKSCTFASKMLAKKQALLPVATLAKKRALLPVATLVKSQAIFLRHKRDEGPANL